MKKIILFALCCVLLTNMATAKDAVSEKINALEKQMLELQKQYDDKIAEMRSAIAELKEKEAKESTEEELYSQIKNKAELSKAPVSAQKNTLNISSVLDFNYYHENSKEGLGHMREEIAGFGHHHHDEAGHHHHHGDKNGFNLRHIELSLSTEVDPYFRAWTTLAFEDGEDIEVEEAVIQSTSLPKGFTLSAGKYKSGIGRLNRQHSHNWDFFDAPLVYQKFFGHHGLIEKGLQLTWLAPTKEYLLFGAEVGNGENEAFASYIGGHDFPEHGSPRLYTAFVKYSPELGYRQSLQLGLSYATSHSQRKEHEDEGGTITEHLYDGRNNIYGVDFVYKYYALQDKGKGDWTVQGEYFQRRNRMILMENSKAYNSKHDGFYVQALYGFAPRWRVGARFDNLGMRNHVEELDETEDFGRSRRISGMLDYKLSEYSLLRFQVGRNNFAVNDGREKAWEYALQLQVSLGSHPAHDF